MTYYQDKLEAHRLTLEAVEECYNKDIQIDAVKLYHELMITHKLPIGKSVIKEALTIAKEQYPLAEIIKEDKL